jgi:branched-chain amino acid transport system permease protein
MRILLQVAISGLFLGGVYALVATGLTLIYGVLKLINFAHGEFLMLGMYVSYAGLVAAGIDPYLSLPIVAIVLFLLGALVERVLIQRVLTAPTINQFLLTMGLSSLMVGLTQFTVGSQPRMCLLPYAHRRLQLGGLIFNLPRFASLLVSAVLAGLLYIFLRRSRMGKAIRACSQSRAAAHLMGVNVKRIYTLTFALGIGITGIAGVLLTPSYPICPTTGQIFTISAFVIVVLGTMGNFAGALLGALIIGFAEAFGGYILGPNMKQVVSMVIFILVLLVRPEGLFGGKAT